eukprot:evm.model.NODE_24622_length_62854_cov_30.334282.15
MAEPQAAEAANGVEEEPNNDDDVWGHTPASSVYGLDDDEDEFEPTPEESPYPLFAEDDIAGLPQDESEVGSIVEEGHPQEAAVNAHRAACDDMDSSKIRGENVQTMKGKAEVTAS